MSETSDVHNRGGFTAFLFAMAFVFVFFFYLVVIHPGVDLGENVVDPNAPKDSSAAPVFDMASVKEPWISTPEIVEHGAKIYKTNCSMCHGAEGKGDGAAAATMNPKPRNFVEGKWTQGEGIIAHYHVLQNGIKGGSMASFEQQLKPYDRWAVLHFIESITQNKSKDDPAKVAEFAKTAN
ncbi:MAG: cytochrome c [Bdellovibrionales bacterium]|nr:cytochrome c [Bdellovibrionales bacterium]